MSNRKLFRGLVLLLAGSMAAAAQKEERPTPGMNFFSKAQDIQIGKEAAGQIRAQHALVDNRDLEAYCNRIISRLASSPAADGGSYPYHMQVVSDKSINAFALPGGPMFIHTGLLAAAENEAQLAAVLAHEMSHVALRHGTSQMSKANMIQIPAMLAVGILGGSGWMGQLERLGVQALTGSVLLRFSRNAERDADLNGARIMSDAGYDPLQMARFFAKLEAGSGKQNPFAEFLSDHPNPENRVKSVEQQAKYLPRRQYDNGSPAELEKMKKIVASLPPAQKPRPGQLSGQGSVPAPVSAGPVPRELRISTRFQTHQGRGFEMGFPQEWQSFENARARTTTLAPREAVFAAPSGEAQVFGYGVQAGVFQTAGRADLQGDTARLARQLQAVGLRRTGGESRKLRVDGQDALLTLLASQSPYEGESETDVLLTIVRPEGLQYFVFFTPQTSYAAIEPVFEQITNSIKFR